MLQQNFKSAADLGIPEEWRQGLIRVMGMLERDELVHVKVYCSTVEQMLPMMFNMNFWALDVTSKDKDECGSVHCIGGWVEKVTGSKLPEDRWPEELAILFYPNENSAFEGETRDFYQRITVEQAAHAMHNYLTYGSPRWEQVLAR